MDRTCYRCGAPVDDSAAFCPQCNAPQIRVPAPESQPATPPLVPGTPADAQPPAQPVPMPVTAGPIVPSVAEPARMDWSRALPAAIVAVLLVSLLVVLAAIPGLGVLVWMAGTGAGAVLLYRRRVPGQVITPGMGARIGAVAGLFGFGIFTVLLALQMLLTRKSGYFRGLLQQAVERAASQNADPRAQEMLQRFTSPEGLAVLLTIVLVMAFVAFLLFSSLGGALASRFTHRREN